MTGPLLTPATGASRDACVRASATGEPLTRTTRPMVTGSSVVGMRCADGVVLACDTLASYGSLARFRAVSRMYKATERCVVAAGGDLSDFQELQFMLERETTENYCMNDGHELAPRAVHQFLARVMYNRRNKMDPLWNRVVIAGWQDAPVLGLVDLVGTHFESEVIATGFGEYLGLPLLRKAWREDITVEEGRKVVEEVMKVLFYRDARTIDRIEIAVVKEGGVEICEPFKLETKWSYKAFVAGAGAKADVATS